jgi:hypothetical protein
MKPDEVRVQNVQMKEVIIMFGKINLRLFAD